jgi:hypothetical protein
MTLLRTARAKVANTATAQANGGLLCQQQEFGKNHTFPSGLRNSFADGLSPLLLSFQAPCLRMEGGLIFLFIKVLI